MKSNPQVLLIDRNVSDVKVVRDTLGTAGLEIHVRASASAALVAFHALEPDVVIVDSDVPGTTGAAVTREIKNTERGRATPVILIAEGPLEESQRAQALTSSGCTLVLQKPLMPQDLIDTLTRFLPNAFIGENKSATPAKPKSTAKRRAAGVMRDPGTPFTADSFDEESLRALLDQVFPTSDSGKLAQTIRTRGAAGAETSEAEPSAPAKASTAPDIAVSFDSSAALSQDAGVEPSPAPSPLAAKSGIEPAAVADPPPPSPAADEPAAAASPAAAIEDTSEFVAEYLAQETTEGAGDTKSAGLTVQDAETLDRIFDGPESKPVMVEDREIEPLAVPEPDARKPEAATPWDQASDETKPDMTPDASSQESAPQSTAATSEKNAPFIDDSFDGLGFDEPAEPAEPANVWGELEAALPPAIASSGAQAPASAPFEAAMTEHAPPVGASSASAPLSTPGSDTPTPPTTLPAQTQTADTPAGAESSSVLTATPLVSKPSAPLPTTSYARAVSETTTAPPSSKTTIPLSSMSPSNSTEPARESSAKPQAAPPVETIPLARETDSKSAATTSSESRRSKKNKKSKGRHQEGPEPIPVAAPDSSALTAPQAAPESRGESAALASSEPEPFHAEASPDLHYPTTPPTKKRTGLIVIAVGVALAAAAGAFYVLTRSSDSDLRPVAPDRDRTPSSQSTIDREEPSPASESPAELDAQTPVIPEASAPSATESAPHASDPSNATGTAQPPASSPDVGPPAPPARGASTPAPAGPPAMPESSRPPKGSGATSKSSALPPPPAHPAMNRNPSAPGAAPVPAAMTRGHAASSPTRPSSSSAPAPDDREPPATAPAETPGRSPAAPSGPEAAETLPPPSNADPPSGDSVEKTSTGLVALGAAMPASPDSVPGAGAAAGETVTPLLSPIPLSRPAPAYPPAALAMKTTGTVGLLVKVEADGHVSDVKIVRPASPTLNAAAVAASRRWRYKPAHRGMDPVATWIEENVVFRLK